MYFLIKYSIVIGDLLLIIWCFWLSCRVDKLEDQIDELNKKTNKLTKKKTNKKTKEENT